MIRKPRRFLPTLVLAVAIGLALALASPALAQDGTPTTVYTTRSVFMRSGPDITWHVIATLPAGEQLTVIETTSYWYKVQRADGTVGWVSGAYLTADAPGSGGGAGLGGTSILPKPPGTGTFARVTSPVLNVRSGPGLNNPVIGTVKGGETVTVLGSDRQWRLIRTASGLQGWVNSLHLSASVGPAGGGSGLPAGGATGGALGGSLNIREVVFDHAVRDASRPGGAIVTIRIEFTGGTGPFSITSDGFSKGSGLTAATRTEGTTTVGTLIFTEPSDCGGTMVHTITLTAANGQSASRGYYVNPVICPN